MQHLAQTAFDFKTDAPTPLDVFKARAWAIAKLVANSMMGDKAGAIDGLWRYAEAHGLVAELGVDAVQALLSEAFREC